MRLDYSDLLAVPFKYGGRDKAGFDCYGLVMEVYRRLGKTLPELEYKKDLAEFVEVYPTYKARFIELSSVASYSIVVFKSVPPYVTHVGVVLGDNKSFIHILENSYVVIEPLKKWKNKIVGFYTYE